MGSTWSICTCPTGYQPKGHREAQKVTVCYGNAPEETARLILAAPDLLAALEGMDEELSLWGADTIETMNLTARLDAIRTAIAKAKGE